MRDIKFRGKLIDNNIWVDGDLVTTLTPSGNMVTCPAIHTTNGTIGTFFVHPKTVCQFTGLCDKNGKEIYEGDVVEGFCYSDFYTGIEGNVNAIVRWIDSYAGFMFDIDARYFHDMRDARKIEIIGNVFDNPELLSNRQ